MGLRSSSTAANGSSIAAPSVDTHAITTTWSASASRLAITV
jgi:hypothetical protein